MRPFLTCWVEPWPARPLPLVRIGTWAEPARNLKGELLGESRYASAGIVWYLRPVWWLLPHLVSLHVTRMLPRMPFFNGFHVITPDDGWGWADAQSYRIVAHGSVAWAYRLWFVHQFTIRRSVIRWLFDHGHLATPDGQRIDWLRDWRP